MLTDTPQLLLTIPMQYAAFHSILLINLLVRFRSLRIPGTLAVSHPWYASVE